MAPSRRRCCASCQRSLRSRRVTRAWGAPAGSALIRSSPEDFRVTEELGFELSGEGEHCFLYLESPIARVTGLDTPFPLTLEKEYLPDHLKIVEAIRASVNF